jgi:hypothetical protein
MEHQKTKEEALGKEMDVEPKKVVTTRFGRTIKARITVPVMSGSETTTNSDDNDSAFESEESSPPKKRVKNESKKVAVHTKASKKTATAAQTNPKSSQAAPTSAPSLTARKFSRPKTQPIEAADDDDHDALSDIF